MQELQGIIVNHPPSSWDFILSALYFTFCSLILKHLIEHSFFFSNLCKNDCTDVVKFLGPSILYRWTKCSCIINTNAMNLRNKLYFLFLFFNLSFLRLFAVSSNNIVLFLLCTDQKEMKSVPSVSSTHPISLIQCSQ